MTTATSTVPMEPHTAPNTKALAALRLAVCACFQNGAMGRNWIGSWFIYFWFMVALTPSVASATAGRIHRPTEIGLVNVLLALRGELVERRAFIERERAVPDGLADRTDVGKEFCVLQFDAELGGGRRRGGNVQT